MASRFVRAEPGHFQQYKVLQSTGSFSKMSRRASDALTGLAGNLQCRHRFQSVRRTPCRPHPPLNSAELRSPGWDERCAWADPACKSQ